MKFKCLWIDRQGICYDCSNGRHTDVAFEILSLKHFLINNDTDPETVLLNMGFVKTYYIFKGFYEYYIYYSCILKPTKNQIEVILELMAENKCNLSDDLKFIKEKINEIMA